MGGCTRNVRRPGPLALCLLVTAFLGCDFVLDAIPDGEAPRLEIDVPVESRRYLTNESQVRVAGRALDPQTVERVTYEAIDGERPVGITPGRAVEFAFMLPLLEVGDSVAVRAYDADGNVASAVFPAPAYDSLAPSVTLGAPSVPGRWTTPRLRLAGYAEDVAGVDSVVVNVRMGRSWNDRVGLLPAVFDTVVTITLPYVEQAAELVFVAYDGFGDPSDPVVFPILVDAGPPRLTALAGPLSRPAADARLLLRLEDFGSGPAGFAYSDGSDTLAVQVFGNPVFTDETGQRVEMAIIIPAADDGSTLVGFDSVGNTAAEPWGWLEELDLIAISGDGSHTCALAADGRVFCAPRHASDGSRGRLTPVGGGQTFARVETGLQSDCALDAAGRAYCWGSNHFGQLGDGTREDRVEPVEVAGAHSFAEIRVGLERTCALDTSGSAYCWGLLWAMNEGGYLVQDTVTTPRVIAAPVPLRSLGMGSRSEHACGLDMNGAAYCWGRPSAYDSTADWMAVDTGAVPVAGGPYQLVEPLGFWTHGWTFAVTADGTPTTLAGLGPVEEVQALGGEPFDTVIAAENRVCLLEDGQSPRCMWEGAGPEVASMVAQRLGLEVDAYSAGPCFLAAAGALYCGWR